MELFEYIVCKSCGKRVVKNSATQKYCSYACDYKAKRKRLLEDRKNNPQKYKDRDKRLGLWCNRKINILPNSFCKTRYFVR